MKRSKFLIQGKPWGIKPFGGANQITNNILKNLIIILFSVVFLSCEYIQVDSSKKTENDKIIASVGEDNLYESDLENLLPENYKEEDSIVLTKSFINTWAKELLLYKRAKENLSEDQNDEIDQSRDHQSDADRGHGEE